ncbi:MipA/OmpV family protein [Sulfitobacter sp. F26169L]|uniref:MipA/OmpV family protein n=1 Tax=Sulfitobacter sp. F26169L TaxID=2996015 RepID=UPI002260A368|nr:MipA/OmpV family protein [Sulfitobacter sp. F26169L]MCX7567370.1 MipA/OmpV family protein [Sulfitobacter sp. F26169L]
MRVSSFLLASVCAVSFAVPAVAQDNSFNFSLRGGIAGTPEYMGSDQTEAGVDLGFSFGALRMGRLDIGNGVRGVPDNGLSLRGAFRMIGDRKAEDSPELAGLEDIDIAVELGFGLTYQQTNWLAFGEVRKGVTGHSGIAGTLGADLIYRPSDRWLFTAGPRVNFGDDKYANTYFGIPTGSTSSFAAYDAQGGALGAGLQVAGTYFIDDKWALEGAITYEKLLNDAADSPITLNGSDDQWRVRLGLSRVFTLNF